MKKRNPSFVAVFLQPCEQVSAQEVYIQVSWYVVDIFNAYVICSKESQSHNHLSTKCLVIQHHTDTIHTMIQVMKRTFITIHNNYRFPIYLQSSLTFPFGCFSVNFQAAQGMLFGWAVAIGLLRIIHKPQGFMSHFDFHKQIIFSAPRFRSLLALSHNHHHHH